MSQVTNDTLDTVRQVETLPKLPPGEKAIEARNLLISADYTSGMHPDQLQQKYNLSRAQIYKIISNDAVRERVEQTVKMYLAHADEVGRNFIDLTDDEDKAIKLNAIKEYHKVTGITPAHTISPVLQQVFNAENVQVNQQMGELGKFLKWQMEQTQEDSDE